MRYAQAPLMHLSLIKCFLFFLFRFGFFCTLKSDSFRSIYVISVVIQSSDKYLLAGLRIPLTTLQPVLHWRSNICYKSPSVCIVIHNTICVMRYVQESPVVYLILINVSFSSFSVLDSFLLLNHILSIRFLPSVLPCKSRTGKFWLVW